ncbi:MAG: DUF5703 domain-containing protein [Planctomycetota bacterium]|jgi:hypothetical protein
MGNNAKLAAVNIVGFFVTALLLSTADARNTDILSTYNVIWNSQSANAGESMPVGGGDIGLNVWVENNELLFYIGRSGTFDENNHMLKLGRVRLKLDPNPFSKEGEFRQELKLRQGYIKITGKAAETSAIIKIWVEVFHPVVHVDIDSDTAVSVTTQYENWRTTARELPADDRKSRFPCMSLVGYPGKVTVYPDHLEHRNNTVLWYHRNRDDDLLFDKEMKQQELEEVKDVIWNPLKDRTFGGLMKGEGMVSAGKSSGRYAHTDFKAWNLRSQSAQKSHKLKIYLHTAQSKTVKRWKKVLYRLVREADRSEESAWDKHQAWWKQFWDRSHVFINFDRPDPNDKGWQIGRNYQLFRYMLGCNAYGKWPTKFNGSFFTYDPAFVRNKRGVKTESPDFRTWGGGYRRALPAAELRTKVYWGHEGCSFTEQLENFGLPVGSCYGWLNGTSRWGLRKPDTPRGVQSIGCVYQFGHQLDFSFMMLEYYRYSGRDISAYIPFIESSVTFFDEHYQFRHKQRTGKPLDENGHLVIFPSRACESYVDAKNPSDVIAGLKVVLSRLLELPDELVPSTKKEKLRAMLERVPPLPLKQKDGRSYLAGAEEWSRFAVGEIPQLYAVFPYGHYGIGRPNLKLARFTWTDSLMTRQKKMREPWYQGGIFTAKLGFTDEAKEIAIFKLGVGRPRFPGFRDTDDWCPDHNWLGAGMIGLQEMLMQAVGQKIYLFPAWPKDWDVDFKLHPPYQTVVEGVFRNGEVETLKVTPKKRNKDVKMVAAQ